LRLLSTRGVGADLLIHYTTHPDRPLFLHTTKQTELDDYKYETWHPVTEAWRDRVEGKTVIRFRFGDGTPEMAIDIGEAITFATLA
jgi:hypothetical protein